MTRIQKERDDLWRVANRIDRANALRAQAQVQDQIVRLDYESSMGAALDELRLLIDEINLVATGWPRRNNCGYGMCDWQWGIK